MVRTLALSSTSISVLPKKHLVSLVGHQGSGKSTLGKNIAALYKCPHLEMSSIVRAVVTGLSRDELPATAERTKTDPNWLADTVYKLIESETIGNVIVITGVRETQIHRYLLEKGLELHSFEVKAQPALRYERLLEIQKVSTAEQFLNHELNEIRMGLRQVMNQARYVVETAEETSAKALASAMRKKLLLKGVK